MIKKIFTLFDDNSTEHVKVLLETSELKDFFMFEIFKNIEDLINLDLNHYNVLFIYINHKKIHDQLYNKIVQFIRNGGSMLALHSTTASFYNQPTFFDLIGARFEKHGPIRRFIIRPTTTNNTLYKDIDEFEIEDELFRQKYQANIKTHFYYKGRTVIEPVVWSKTYGKGMIIGLSPGHQIETMKNRNIQRIIEYSLNRLTI